MKVINIKINLTKIYKWFNRAAIVGFILLFRAAIIRNDIFFQYIWGILIIGNAWCHWKGLKIKNI